MAEDAVLGFLEKNEEILDSGKFSEEKGISHDELVNVIKSLNGFGFVIAQDIKRERWVLSEEGKIYAVAGSPEVQLFLAIPPEGITQEELQKKLDPAIFRVGWPQVMKNKWVEKGKSNVSRKVQNVDDTIKGLLMKIQNGELRKPPLLHQRSSRHHPSALIVGHLERRRSSPHHRNLVATLSEELHSKRRSRLEHNRLNDLVFVKYNRALKKRWEMRDSIDPISLDSIDQANEWLCGIPDDADELVFDDGDGLTWGHVAAFSGAGEAPYSLRRASKGKEKAGSSKGKQKVSERTLVDEDDDEEDDEVYDDVAVLSFDNLGEEELEDSE